MISAKITSTSDVRDKIAKSFTEDLGYASILATVFFIHNEPVFNEDTGKEQNMAHIEIKPVGSSWEDAIKLSQLMRDVELHDLFSAFKREIAFRKRTGFKWIIYNTENHPKCADEIRDYSIEDTERNDFISKIGGKIKDENLPQDKN